MLDPLTALGVASNIIQLVQFTSDLVSKSREYYDSADGALVEQLELEAITKSLQELSKDLIVPTGGWPNAATTKQQLSELSNEFDGDLAVVSKAMETEKQLSELCRGCREVSKELLIIIQGLKSKGTRTKWKSFRQALKSVLEEDKIKALEARLDRYRRQIDTTLLISLRASLSGLSKPDGHSEHVSHIILSSKMEVKQWERELVDKVHQTNWKLQNEMDMVHFSAKLSASAREEAEVLVKNHILEKLRFGELEDRTERIPKPHRKTFDWIFQGSEASEGQPTHIESRSNPTATGDSSKDPKKQGQWSNFVSWLRSNSSLYWITGKAGSGKSTLMKFLQGDHRTMEFLAPWVDKHAVTVVGHFFWNSGAAMQMSKLGLLQTLLYGAIKDNPDLTSAVFPRRWKSYQLFGGDLHDWSMSELLQAFRLLISDDSTRFFFFIDGLDEFDGDGAEIVTFILESMASRENVKFCVASRPWLVFEDAFQQQPSLRVEDLTTSDIRLFVTEKLRENHMFATLNELEPSAAHSLIAEVTEKASGVFLWVQLVVLSLLEGLRDGDCITDLQARLLILPSDLEELFEKMLRDLNPAYFEQASMYFQIVRASMESLTLLTFSFAEEGMDKAISYKTRPESDQELDFRAERMRRRLSSRCKGLLEAPRRGLETQHAKVQYLHRTVRDYVYKQNVWDFVASGTNETFDPNVALSASYLLAIKTMTPTVENLRDFWASLRFCADHSLKFENSQPDVNILLLDELSRAGDALFESRGPTGTAWFQDCIAHQNTLQLLNPNVTSHWTCTEWFQSGFEHRTTSFLGFAFVYPLHTYVDEKLRNTASLDMHLASESLLCAASCAFDVRLTGLLFELGADPNLHENEQMGWTTWQQFLWEVKKLDKTSRDCLGQIVDIVQLYLEHGANTQVAVDDVPLDDLINERFRNLDAAKTDQLLRKVKVAQKITEKRRDQGRETSQPLYGTLPLLERTMATIDEPPKPADAMEARDLKHFHKSLIMSVVSKEPSKKANKSRRLWDVFRLSKNKD